MWQFNCSLRHYDSLVESVDRLFERLLIEASRVTPGGLTLCRNLSHIVLFWTLIFSWYWSMKRNHAGIAHMLMHNRAALALTLLLAICILNTGCTSRSPLVPVDPGSSPNESANESVDAKTTPLVFRTDASEYGAVKPYRVRPGDELSITFYNTPELDEDVQVLPDGTIALKLVGVVPVDDRSPGEIAEDLQERYKMELSDPQIAVIVRNVRDFKIFVGGEVEQPQVVDFTPDMTPVEAVYSAGGFLQSANLEQLVVIRKDEDRRPVPYLIDMKRYLSSDVDPILLRPLDIVFVPKSKIARVNDFVDQYLAQLLLFRGIGVTFGYDLDDNDDN